MKYSRFQRDYCKQPVRYLFYKFCGQRAVKRVSFVDALYREERSVGTFNVQSLFCKVVASQNFKYFAVISEKIDSQLIKQIQRSVLLMFPQLPLSGRCTRKRTVKW